MHEMEPHAVQRCIDADERAAEALRRKEALAARRAQGDSPEVSPIELESTTAVKPVVDKQVRFDLAPVSYK